MFYNSLLTLSLIIVLSTLCSSSLSPLFFSWVMTIDFLFLHYEFRCICTLYNWKEIRFKKEKEIIILAFISYVEQLDFNLSVLNWYWHSSVPCPKYQESFLSCFHVIFHLFGLWHRNTNTRIIELYTGHLPLCYILQWDILLLRIKNCFLWASDLLYLLIMRGKGWQAICTVRGSTVRMCSEWNASIVWNISARRFYTIIKISKREQKPDFLQVGFNFWKMTIRWAAFKSWQQRTSL